MRHRLIKTLLPVVAVLGLAACTADEIRFASTAVEPTARITTRYSSVEVAEVTLPVYADSEEIFTEDATGALTALGPLWADDPSRAMTLQISRDLASITGAKVAPEPWPFRDYAAAKVDIRIEEMVATRSGLFRISGQFFVAPDAGGADRSVQFSVSAPFPSSASASQIAAARAVATTKLAEDIAARGLR